MAATFLSGSPAFEDALQLPAAKKFTESADHSTINKLCIPLHHGPYDRLLHSQRTSQC
ncbi:hypothetical protein PISMIDRAFT_686452 [Pisolithus microcarpus 441]|uniref:Uncharacterized protein n=1 Tax=Pisolithus microcarpus 441 TaxID=765257 RepID=A0A0C9YHW4_9AGAM|nr:hypothetical protein BKA83DRAFT_686452 [Pisolithus microcarpus]KIK16286.1 hypothetical protein PISMIDRAFT_686452 [Pisolithus microcarpus 441]